MGPKHNVMKRGLTPKTAYTPPAAGECPWECSQEVEEQKQAPWVESKG